MYDVVIVGAGPAGLSVAIEAKKNNLTHLIIDKGTVANSIVKFPKEMTFFSTSELLEIGDIPLTSNDIRPTRRELILYYQKVVNFYRLNIHTFEKLVKLEGEKNNFSLYTEMQFADSPESKKDYQAKNIVIATGFYDHPKMLDIEGEDQPNVSHYYSEPFNYFNRDVLIAGGGNSAVEAALDIYRHGGRVTLMHRDEHIKKSIKYWILPDIQNRIAEGSIQFISQARISAIKNNGVYYIQNNEKKRHACDDVLLLTGYLPDEQIYRICNINYNQETLEPEINKNTFETSVKGVYTAGSMIAGQFSNKVFIENSREHAKPIIESINSNLEG